MSDRCEMCAGFGEITQARVNCPACDGTGRDCGYRAPRPCEVCGRAAQQMGTEARCAEHDSEKETGR